MGVFGPSPNVVKIETQLLRLLRFALLSSDCVSASMRVIRAKHSRAMLSLELPLTTRASLVDAGRSPRHELLSRDRGANCEARAELHYIHSGSAC
jgi:hypothetical protein